MFVSGLGLHRESYKVAAFCAGLGGALESLHYKLRSATASAGLGTL